MEVTMSISSKDALRLDQLRRAAKTLKKSYEAGEPGAVQLVQNLWGKTPETHADFLHVVARQHGFVSWPRLKWAAETVGLERAEAQERLKMALYNGNRPAADALLSAMNLAQGHLGLLCDLRSAGVKAVLSDAPKRRLSLLDRDARSCMSPFPSGTKWGAMLGSLSSRKLLVAHGADMNDSWAHNAGSEERLPVFLVRLAMQAT